MRDGRKEGFQALSGQHAAAASAHRDGNDDRESRPGFLNTIQSRLGVECIEASLYDNQIDSAFYQRPGLSFIGGRNFIKAARAPFRTCEISDQREGLGARAHAPGHPDLAGSRIGGLACKTCGSEGHVPGYG